MKQSIKSIFNTVFFSVISLAIIALVLIIISLDYNNSYEKIQNIYQQKAVALEIVNYPKDANIDNTLNQIAAKSIHLQSQTTTLLNIYDFSIIEHFIADKNDYLKDVDALNRLIAKFTQNANNYFTNSKTNSLEEQKKAELEKSFYELLLHQDDMIKKTIDINKKKLSILRVVAVTLFILLVATAFLHKSRLKSVYEDLVYLLDVSIGNYVVFSQEADAIALRMKKKPQVSENPTMIEGITGLKNLKGLMNSYGQKKGLKDENFTSVTIYEIDDFQNLKAKYPQEFIESIFKKISGIMSLHEKIADVVAFAENQFILVLSRPTKDECYKESNNIRQSIAELKFSSAQTGAMHIYLSGGFVIKPNNVSLEESMKQAKKILNYAQSSGGNKISQIRDLAHSEL